MNAIKQFFTEFINNIRELRNYRTTKNYKSSLYSDLSTSNFRNRSIEDLTNEHLALSFATVNTNLDTSMDVYMKRLKVEQPEVYYQIYNPTLFESAELHGTER